MSDQDLSREWLRENLDLAGRGARKALADHLGIEQSAITRMLQTEAGKERRDIDPRELSLMARFFKKDLPAGLEFRVVPAGQEFDEDPDPDSPMTSGEVTGHRGIPTDASPQLDVTAGMGAGGVTIVSEGVPGERGMTFSAEHVRDYWRLPPEILAAMRMRPGDVTIIPVQGDSMSDTLIEDDLVFVDTRHRLPSPDGIYALGDDFGGIVVKRLQIEETRDDEVFVKVISDNKTKHESKVKPLSELRIIGRVVRRFGVVK